MTPSSLVQRALSWLGWESPPALKAPESLRDAVAERRAALKAAGLGINARQVPPGAMGIAFSGGGIRSATISLGIAQALVRQDKLLDFDYCSTVSGGGYFGSFLTSLFIPDRARGPNAVPVRPSDPAAAAEILAKKKVAFDALGSNARSVNLVRPGDLDLPPIRNPVWWLREHSRYLAPNGTSDYLVAAVYMVRNWLAMIYVMALPMAMMALVLIGIDSSVFALAARGSSSLAGFAADARSALWPILPAIAFLALSFSVAFWFSEVMTNRGDRTAQGRRLRRWLEWLGMPRPAMTLYTLGGMAAAALVLRWVPRPVGWPALYTDFLSQSPFHQAVAFGCGLLFLSSLLGLLVVQTTRGDFEGNALIAEARRRITLANACTVKVILFIAAIALVDSLSIWLYHRLIQPASTPAAISTAISAAALPILAWIINHAQDWFKEKDSLVKRLIGRSISTIALVAGAFMFLTLAIGVHLLAQQLMFAGAAWQDGDRTLGSAYAAALLILAFLTISTGWMTGFINLSSLHGIYASRLTRAYLGASNRSRLEKALPSKRKPDPKDKASPRTADAVPAAPDKVGGAALRVHTSIKDSDPFDQIPVDVYQQTLHLGPLHLINVTLNETRSPEGSQLLERDRKGLPLVFAPEGVLVNAARERQSYKRAEAKSWALLEQKGVEKLSVGQLCAISGAAASTAMGSMTTLGGALALSFANIRLGYWWDARDLFRTLPTLRDTPGKWLYQKSTRPFRTYFYLFNELVANYSRENARLNLSDGGHFDNSGAYELLRRKTKAIIVCDNGADPDFRFGDLEVLIRKARLDLGVSLRVADATTVEQVAGKPALPLFLNGEQSDWRVRAAARSDQSGPSSPEDRAFCVLLEVFNAISSDEVIARILWIKPRLFAGLPQDVIGYALEHADFPHETTGDQFFNEAQWESYRALGFAAMTSLLAGPWGNGGLLRGLIPRAARVKKSSALPSPGGKTAKPSGGADAPRAPRPRGAGRAAKVAPGA